MVVDIIDLAWLAGVVLVGAAALEFAQYLHFRD